MTLYQLYRPKEFSEMIGNKEAIKSLSTAFNKPNHSHVYLFSGPAGTGKTTAARIMARELNAGELDIREINSSSNRGIDTAREIIEQIRMYPIEGDHIVYIMDECHRWTTDFSNAILKPLEDTPEHVYFFLCTTDPGKLLKAIRSRCTEIKFNLLPSEEILLILRRVNKQEGINLSKDLLNEISENCGGSPRKALVLLERVMNVEEQEEALEIIRMGVDESDPQVIELCRALLNNKSSWQEIADILKTLREANKLEDSESVRFAVLGYMSSVLLSGKKPDRALLALEAFSEPTYNNGKFGIILACLRVIT